LRRGTQGYHASFFVCGFTIFLSPSLTSQIFDRILRLTSIYLLLDSCSRFNLRIIWLVPSINAFSPFQNRYSRSFYSLQMVRERSPFASSRDAFSFSPPSKVSCFLSVGRRQAKTAEKVLYRYCTKSPTQLFSPLPEAFSSISSIHSPKSPLSYDFRTPLQPSAKTLFLLPFRRECFCLVAPISVISPEAPSIPPLSPETSIPLPLVVHFECS